MTPGATLRRMREDAKWTLAETSRRLHDRGWELSLAQLAKIETGGVQNIKLYDALALCDLYRISLDDMAALYYPGVTRSTAINLDPYQANILAQLRQTLEHAPKERGEWLASILSALVSSSSVPAQAEAAVTA